MPQNPRVSSLSQNDLESLGVKGTPVDFSQGASLMPPRPRMGDSTPGRTTSGRIPSPMIAIPPELQAQMEEEAARAQQEVDEERQAAFREAPPSPIAPPAPASHQAQSPSIKKVTKPVHAILSQLRADLGLDSFKPIELVVADHTWSFVPLTPQLISYAARTADMLSMQELERDILLQYASVCFSIVAIDHVPVWMVFGLEPEEADNVKTPLIPKGPIRARAAVALLEELMQNTKLGLLQALLEAYNAKVDSEGEVKGHTAYDNKQYFRFECPEEGCSVKVVRPKKTTENGTAELPYFCESHGVPLKEVGTLLPKIDEALNPLVSSSQKKTQK